MISDICDWDKVTFMILDHRLLDMYEAEDRGFVTHITVGHEFLSIVYPDEKYSL